MEESKKCLVENCTGETVARGLCGVHYAQWHRSKEEMVKLMNGPFTAVRQRKAGHSIRQDSPESSRRSFRPVRKQSIAPGSQVVKNILAKAGYDGELQKAVDLLIAKGFLAEELLQAARVMVRYESSGNGQRNIA